MLLDVLAALDLAHRRGVATKWLLKFKRAVVISLSWACR